MDLGYNIYIFKSVLDEKVRKKDLRSLLLDLLNVLFDKKNFALCSRSGKKGKATDTAKPELDINKRHAIRSKFLQILIVIIYACIKNNLCYYRYLN